MKATDGKGDSVPVEISMEQVSINVKENRDT